LFLQLLRDVKNEANKEEENEKKKKIKRKLNDMKRVYVSTNRHTNIQSYLLDTKLLPTHINTHNYKANTSTNNTGKKLKLNK